MMQHIMAPMIVEIFKHCFFEKFSSKKRNKKGRFLFSIVADEVSGCSSKEQVPLVLRCVDESGEIIERFMNFIYFD